MTTDELLSASKKSFQKQLAVMDLKTCEIHVREIVAFLDGASFDSYMRRVTREVNKYPHMRRNDLGFYYAVTEEVYPWLHPLGLLERLTQLALLLVKE